MRMVTFPFDSTSQLHCPGRHSATVPLSSAIVTTSGPIVLLVIGSSFLPARAGVSES
jgi:hypothetical protein